MYTHYCVIIRSTSVFNATTTSNNNNNDVLGFIDELRVSKIISPNIESNKQNNLDAFIYTRIYCSSICWISWMFDENLFQSSWRCSVCRRKIASRDQPIVTQESTDSLLEVPVLEALQRRHSDARLGCQSGSQIGGLGSGLAPPRSPELRRHSDVSPASLKELEKVMFRLILPLNSCLSNIRASRQPSRIDCNILHFCFVFISVGGFW